MIKFQSSEKIPNLYSMPGLDIPMEFSDDNHRNQIERDITQIQNMEEYQPKKYGELDHDSPNLHLQITQQIIERAKENKHKDFFEITDNVKNSEPFRKGYAINYDQYYNNKTGKYEKAFKSQEVTNAMQNLHLNDFNQQVSSAKRQSNFIQKESKSYSKRPSYLPKDVKSQFLEVSEEAKIAALKYNWQYLETYNCWASSRWEFAFLFICWNWVWSTIYLMWIFPYSYLRPYANICIWIWFLSYPCSSSIGGRGVTWFWMSEKLSEEGKMQPVTFRLEFDVIRRVKFHNLLFMSVPDEVKIEISQDHTTWESATEFIKTPDRSRWWWWFYSFQYHYPPQTFAKSCKIIMKGLRRNWGGNRHGLWWVDFYTQTQTVQIMDKNTQDESRCLARAEVGYYQTNKPFILMNCLDAILQNDSREAFFLDFLFIKQWADNMCISVGNKIEKEATKFLTSNLCRDNDDFKFVIDRLGKIMSKASPTTCIAAKDDNQISQVQPYGYLKVSASLSDSRVNPYDTIDPNAVGFWAVPLELKTASWELIFDRQYMIDEITIKFKFTPKKVSINVLTPENKWFTIVTEQPEDEMIVQMTPSQIMGVHIHMLELDQDKQTEFQRPAYGIKKVIIKRPGKPVSYQTCQYQAKTSKLINRFKIDPIEYIDTSYLVPYKGAKLYMHNVYEQTKVIVEQFIVKIQNYMIVIKEGEAISKNILKINKQVDAIYQELGPFKKYVQMNQNESKGAKGKCYACSPETSASSCSNIRRKKQQRKNGFFWIKTKCMPEAARVFCDFENADSNFYQYVGNFADKPNAIQVKSIQDLIELCDKIGLEPVEISNEKQASNIMDYLQLVNANSQDEIGIPFAYQWAYKILGEKFQSLNNAKSKETTQILKNLMEPQTIMDKLTTIGADMLILKRSKDKLYKGYLSSNKIRGLVCSQNIGQAQKKQSSNSISCEVNLKMLGGSKLNTILKLDCPADCASKKQFKVIGSGPYQDLSSICRAAVHSGAIQDQDGGEIELKVVKGMLEYQEGNLNDVKTVDGQGNILINAFQIVQKPIEVVCPNLKTIKKSFISFDEIIKKVKKKKQQSFIESKEQVQDQTTKDDDAGEQASGETDMDMKKAIGYVNQKLSKKLIVMSKYQQFIKDTQQLFKSYEMILAGVFSSNLNPATQQNLLSTTNLRITATKQMIEDLVRKGQSKLSAYLEDYLKKLDDIFFLQRYDPLNEKYQLDWQSSYISIDNQKTKNGPSNWIFTKDDVFPHQSAIAQTSQISCGQDFKQPQGECTATIQQVKYKQFYDFKLRLDYKIRQQGFFGIIFRMKDQYNYYSFEFQNDVVQFRRMLHGEQTILAQANINKILSDNWYNVEIIATETIFKLSFGKEEDENVTNEKKYNSLKMVLKGQDAYLKNGYQGLQSDGTLGLFIDNYSVIPIDCRKDQFNIEKAIKYQAPKASRFLETYKADISQVWIQHPNEEIPWEYKQNVQGRKKVFFKDVDMSYQQKHPMILNGKQMKQGWGSFDMYLKMKTSQFSFILFLINDKNYHEITISKEKVLFQEIINGKKQILQAEENMEVQIKVWYTVYYEISNENIKTWFEKALVNKSDRIRKPLFPKDITKPQTKGTAVGMSSSKGIVFIDQLKLYPGQVPEPVMKEEDEIANEDENEKENENKDKINDKDANDSNNEQSNQSSQQEGGERPKLIPFDYQICLNTTKTQQYNWCMKKNELPGPFSACKENFCEQCCEKQVGAKKNIVEKCTEQCSKQAVEKDKSYFQCFDSSNAKLSVQAVCPKLFPKKTEQKQANNCKTDFCDLCCISYPLILKKGLQKMDLEECYQNCHNKFDK